MNKKIKIHNLGLKDYKETWDFQELLFNKTLEIKVNNRKNDSNSPTPNHLIFVTHPHVYTLGKSGEFSNLLINKEQLHKKGATYYKTNRGGDITYHGPGGGES